ncbi:Hydroxyproline o-galactosyltransferase galt3 [Thalictrum thalictroides]|uniref:Hydroxyproline o-galactosyltransferase galt3 n=1 Tax=Thalictrum thalictroides TaxID=46969 RepID=A0A7J6VHX7_THATH|nr:Hydroxyproline o-galactosyltransferase galt3 [Thalictrum thalictroides]
MKKWFGGTLIITLAVILGIRFMFMEKQPHKKQSVYEFFRNYPTNDSHSWENDVIIKSPPPQKILQFSKKPYLISVEGIDDLYSTKNISKEESNVMLVWAQMRSLLSRSDVFPDTAQGIKEAAIAWKILLAAIENEKFDVEERKCPFFVNMFNKSLSNNGMILEFPCGLVVDSSITIVGIPSGSDGNFQIELIGSQLPGESNPSIVLYYNVSLPVEDLTKSPVILQNTWTAEDGWGEEERCPGHHPANNLEVDGLIRCNEKLDRNVVEEKINRSQSTDSSSGGNHISFNFPFAEGNPFTATLWVGPEGFHMTVNGRHETSFAHRKKLEPWLISGVKVAGALDLLSALANGLPVSEDLDLTSDAEHLKAPPISSKRVILLIGVFSTGNNFERRMAIRRSWMQYGAVRSGEVAVRFFIGLHKNMQVNLQLWKEAQTYGDIQLMPFVDYYSLITFKTIAICIMGNKILPAKYVMKTDDDAFLRIDEILSNLKGKDSKGLLYGRISVESAPHRDRDSKWYISVEEWPHALYPPWAHGPGYILSRDIVKFIVQGHQERNLNDINLFERMKKVGGLLGFEHGIVLAPMGADVSGPELVAAVANSGAIGLLASPIDDYDRTVKAIRETKKLTDKPFGAGILLEFDNAKTVKAIFDEKLSVMEVYWGKFPKEMVDEAHKHGIKVIHQVGSVKAAERAIAAGVDCIIAQGLEAGGHVAGTVSLMALLPRIVDLVGDRDIPVVAAGSISDARGYAAALALGAKGICVGTRFVATKEANANEYYKQQLLHYTEQQTDRTDLYGRFTWRADVRCLTTPFHQYWRKSPDYDYVKNDETQPIIGQSVIYYEDIMLRRFAGQVANPTTIGQLENMVMLAGQGVGLVNDIVPAREVIRRYVEGAKAIIQELGETHLPKSSSSQSPTTTTDHEEKEIKNSWKWIKKLCM